MIGNCWIGIIKKFNDFEFEFESIFCVIIIFLCIMQGELEKGLKDYQDLIDENPTDFRPYLCQVS